MIILYFLTLLIMIIFIIAIVLISRKAAFIKNVNVVLSVYLFILFVSAIVYFILPKSESGQGVEQQYAGTDQILSEIYAGNVDQVEEYVIDTQSFEYQGQELKLEESDDMWLYGVVIERKAEEDGIIEVRQLNTGMYLNNVNISDKINPVNFRVTNDALVLQNPAPTNVEMTFYKKEFPITQFTSGNNEIQENHDDSYDIGYNIIYLRIPSNVLVKNETPFTVTYVKE